MKALLIALAAATGLTLATGTLAADPGEALTKNNGCVACHSVDKKLVGPSYKEIAAKYKADKGAEAALVKKVKAGGAGTWGQVSMPPHTHVKDDDIKAMTKWILSLK